MYKNNHVIAYADEVAILAKDTRTLTKVSDKLVNEGKVIL